MSPLALLALFLASSGYAPQATPAAVRAEIAPPPLGVAIGVNASGLGNSSAELPFLNLMKLAGAPDSGGQFTVPAPFGKGDFVLLWDGDPAVSVFAPAANMTNTVGWNNMSPTVWKANRIVFHTDVGGSLNPRIVPRGKNPMRNIRLVRADQEALLAAGKIINPDFASFVSRFEAFRTMDWDCTNGGQAVTPADRPKLTDQVWGCAPVEAKVELANLAKVDLWLTIPAHADDELVTAEIRYVHEHLDPALKLHLEFSNEVWNDSFEQHKYAAAQGTKMWGALPWVDQVWYGYRAAQVMSIAQHIYGADANRLNGVLATFGPWTGPQVFDAEIAGIGRAKVGKPSDIFREYAIATYFGSEMGFYPGNEADRPIVLAWAKSGAAGVDKAFQELEHGGLLKANNSLDSAKAVYAIQAARAKSIGLRLVAYEGGLGWTYFPSPDAATFDAFFKAILADPRMGALTRRWASDFAAAGGQLAVHYSDVGAVGKWGPWPLIPRLGAKTPRYEALAKANGR